MPLPRNAETSVTYAHLSFQPGLGGAVDLPIVEFFAESPPCMGNHLVHTYPCRRDTDALARGLRPDHP
jgi:hypothetical protein